MHALQERWVRPILEQAGRPGVALTRIVVLLGVISFLTAFWITVAVLACYALGVPVSTPFLVCVGAAVAAGSYISLAIVMAGR
jgi:hypothetical protein